MDDVKKAKWTGFVVDVEATGPIPGDFSMTEIGCVLLNRNLNTTFYSKLAPLDHSAFSPGALESIGKTIDELRGYKEKPQQVMESFRLWVQDNTKKDTYPMFFSDNNGFDFMFTHWYFVHFIGTNMDPFGHTSRNIADIFRGINKNVKANFKKLRDTKHTHNPVDDAMGNAEAIIKFVDQYGLKGLDIG